MSAAATIDGAAIAAPLVAGAASPGNSIGFEHVSVAYRGTVVLEDLTLVVEPGEILALLGPSGSGKTTALRAVAGFVQPVRGRVRIGGEDVTAMPPYRRGIGLVVQNYALFPHMSVAENVAFGLRARNLDRSVIEERVGNCLAMVGMAEYRRRYPRQLSGGQQQRVALARALAIQPRVLLLDEPLSALDAQIRHAMVEELARLHRDLPDLTILYVTHDQTEALTLADRIGIMRNGRLSSFGSARSLYHRPPNRFAAEFLGRANVLAVRVERVDRVEETAMVRFGENAWRVDAGHSVNAAGPALVCVRPHDLKLEPQPGAGNAVSGLVRAIHWQGETQVVVLDAEGAEIRLVTTPLREPPEIGATVSAHFTPDAATLIPDDGAGNG